MKKLILLISLCGCATSSFDIDVKEIKQDQVYDDSYKYYVLDVNGTEPDAVFDDRAEAADYVEEFKEFHDYRIVKAQSYTNEF